MSIITDERSRSPWAQNPTLSRSLHTESGFGRGMVHRELLLVNTKQLNFATVETNITLRWSWYTKAIDNETTLLLKQSSATMYVTNKLSRPCYDRT